MYKLKKIVGSNNFLIYIFRAFYVYQNGLLSLIQVQTASDSVHVHNGLPKVKRFQFKHWYWSRRALFDITSILALLLLFHSADADAYVAYLTFDTSSSTMILSVILNANYSA